MKVILNVSRLALTLLFLYTGSVILLAQDTGIGASESEVPITSVSEAAVQKYIEGREMVENFKIDEARILFNEAITLDPDFALAYVGKGLTAGDYKEAMDSYEKADALSGKTTPGEKLFIAYYKSNYTGNLKTQEENLTKLLDMFPSDKRALLEAGRFYYGTGDHEKSLAHIKKAVDTDPSFAPAYNMLGYAYAELKNYAEAEKAFKKYVSLQPDLPNAYDSYAESLFMQGKYDESITQYNKALEKDPKFIFSFVGLGNNYCFKKDFEKARENYKKMYDQSETPYNKLSALNYISISYVKEGNIDEALNTLDKRIALAEQSGDIPNVFNSLNSKGYILAESGAPEKGMAQFTSALEKLKNSDLPDEAKKDLKPGIKLNMVYANILQNKLDDAEKTLTAIEPDIISSGVKYDIEKLNFTKGVLALKQNKPDKAADYLSKAGEDNPLVWRYQAIALHKNGDTGKAVECRKKIDAYNQNTLYGALTTYNSQDLAELESGE